MAQALHRRSLSGDGPDEDARVHGAGHHRFFESIGSPGFFAHLADGGEIGLGALLLVGLYARLAALAAMPVLIGATLQRLPNGCVFSAEGGG